MKTKEKITEIKRSIIRNKKAWIIGSVIAVCVLIALVLLASGVFHKKRQYNAEGIEICAKGDIYDISTGKVCKGMEKYAPKECAPGDKFSIITGEACPETPSDVPAPHPVSETTLEAAPAPSTPAAPTAPVATTAAVDLTSAYGKNLTEFKDRALVFDQSCKANPETITVAPNTLVMIANGGQKNARITLNGRNDNLAPKHYDIVFVGPKGTYQATCDGNNSGSVVVQ